MTVFFKTSEKCLTLELDNDNYILFFMDDSGVALRFKDDTEIFSESPVMALCHIKVDGELYTLADLYKMAEQSWHESEIEAREEAAHERYLSSPYLTGRV